MTNLVMSVADHSVSEYRLPSPRDEEQNDECNLIRSFSVPLVSGREGQKIQGNEKPSLKDKHMLDKGCIDELECIFR